MRNCNFFYRLLPAEPRKLFALQNQPKKRGGKSICCSFNEQKTYRQHKSEA